jgi:hypothetical protein
MTDDRDPTDKRAEPRATLIYKPLLVEVGPIVGFCLAKNISSSGMMGRFYTPCSVGAQAKVHFNDFHFTSGMIAWSNDGAIGVKFDEPIDVEQMLALLSQPRLGSKVNRALRLAIEANAEVVCDGRTVPVDLLDISQKGVKLRSPFLNQGDEVVVKIDGLEPRKAMVQWAKGGMAGLNFVRPLNFDQLGEWAVREQAGNFDGEKPSESRRKA